MFWTNFCTQTISDHGNIVDLSNNFGIYTQTLFSEQTLNNEHDYYEKVFDIMMMILTMRWTRVRMRVRTRVRTSMRTR